MKKATKIALFSISLVCCCVFASVITTNIINKRNKNIVYVPSDNASYSMQSQTALRSSSKMQPVDLTASEISVRLGSTWVPPEDYEEFMYDLLDTPWYMQRNIKIHFAHL